MVINLGDYINFTHQQVNPGFIITADTTSGNFPSFQDTESLYEFLHDLPENAGKEFYAVKRDKLVAKLAKKHKDGFLLELIIQIRKNCLINKVELIANDEEREFRLNHLEAELKEFRSMLTIGKTSKKDGRNSIIPYSTLQDLIATATGSKKKTDFKVKLIDYKLTTFTISKEINKQFSDFCKKKSINKSKFVEKLILYEIENYTKNPNDRNFYFLRLRGKKILEECRENVAVGNTPEPDGASISSPEFRSLPIKQKVEAIQGLQLKDFKTLINIVDSLSIDTIDENKLKGFNKSKKSINAEAYACYMRLIRNSDNTRTENGKP